MAQYNPEAWKVFLWGAIALGGTFIFLLCMWDSALFRRVRDALSEFSYDRACDNRIKRDISRPSDEKVSYKI